MRILQSNLRCRIKLTRWPVLQKVRHHRAQHGISNFKAQISNQYQMAKFQIIKKFIIWILDLIWNFDF